jgi:hypothetical protein
MNPGKTKVLSSTVALGEPEGKEKLQWKDKIVNMFVVSHGW